MAIGQLDLPRARCPNAPYRGQDRKPSLNHLDMVLEVEQPLCICARDLDASYHIADEGQFPSAFGGGGATEAPVPLCELALHVPFQ